MTMNVVKNIDVDSTMLFVTPDSKINRRYVCAGTEINTGTFETKKVHVRDVRSEQDKCKLDITGFELFRHKSIVSLS